MLKLWNYFKDSWEGNDGKASSKKLTLLAITATFLIYTWFVQSEIHFKVFAVLGLGVAISILNLTFSNLITLIKFTLPAMGKDEANQPNTELPDEMVKDIIEQKSE